MGPDFLPGPTRLWHGVMKPANSEILIDVLCKDEDWVLKGSPSFCCTVQTHQYLAPVYQSKKKSDTQALGK